MRHFVIVVVTFICLTSSNFCDDVDDRVCDADSVDSFCRQKNSVDESGVGDDPPKKPHPGCKKFRVTDFNETSPSILYLESRGRLGNQVRNVETLNVEWRTSNVDLSTHFSSTLI